MFVLDDSTELSEMVGEAELDLPMPLLRLLHVIFVHIKKILVGYLDEPAVGRDHLLIPRSLVPNSE